MARGSGLLQVSQRFTGLAFVEGETYHGSQMNLFVDHSQIVQVECLRSGLWGTKSLRGRVLTYKG